MLETYIAESLSELKLFGDQRWHDGENVSEWWVLKASKGNGGKDIWIVNHTNFHHVVNEFQTNEQFVIQKCVEKPLLWNRKKFHFRCYGLLQGNNQYIKLSCLY
jgi:hypothetical protein